MGDFNKVISFVLGLIVVVVALVVISRRYDLSKRLLPFSSTAQVSVTPTPTGKVVSEITVSTDKTEETKTIDNKTNNYQTQFNSKTPSAIPSTGSPTLLLPLFGSVLFAGLKLRKRS
jgi:cytoskeletal protein RodZ